MIFGAFCSGITLTQACYKTLYILFRDRRALVWTIANKIEAFARAAQRGTTSRHSWTISTFTRFSRFSRFPTRKQKRSLRRLSNRRLRETFIEPFAFFLRIFSCSFCVFALFFQAPCAVFGAFFIPASTKSKHLGRKWGDATSFGIFPWYFPLYAKLNLSQKRHRC